MHFEPRRKDAQYCSKACRQLAYRLRQKSEFYITEAEIDQEEELSSKELDQFVIDLEETDSGFADTVTDKRNNSPRNLPVLFERTVTDKRNKKSKRPGKRNDVTDNDIKTDQGKGKKPEKHPIRMESHSRDMESYSDSFDDLLNPELKPLSPFEMIDSVFLRNDFERKLKECFTSLLKLEYQKKVPMKKVADILEAMSRYHGDAYKERILTLSSDHYLAFKDSYLSFKRWLLPRQLAEVEKIKVSFSDKRREVLMDVLVALEE